MTTLNWVQLNDYAMVLMNNKLSGKSNVSRSELFLSRPKSIWRCCYRTKDTPRYKNGSLIRTRQRRRFKNICSVGERRASSV